MGIYYKGREMSSGTRVDGDTIQTNASGRIYVAKAPPAYKTYEETKVALVPDLSGDFASKQSVQDLQTALTTDYAKKTDLPATASPGKPGLIGIDCQNDDSNRKYAVKLSGDNAYVHVPWTGGSAGDVAVDGVTIGKKSESEGYAIYVKSISSLSGDLTATMATKAEVTGLSDTLTADYAKKTEIPGTASAGKPGIIGVDYPKDGQEKTYAVKLENGNAYVHVPWTGGSAGDVVVDGVTIGQKDASGDYAIYVKNISTLSNDLTSTMAVKADLPTKVSELQNDSGYLTEHQSLSDYAKKTEIPGTASAGKPGIIGVDYPDDGSGKKYAVKLSGDNAYVHVPWTGGSASDVAVDDITIGKKNAAEDYKIYVKSISSLSGDLTATMATRAFVNSSVATNTSYFRGTYASYDSLSAVSAYNNDYAFVSADSSGNTEFKRYKYLSNEISAQGWQYEYTLNNSSFTEEQWEAINSTIKKETVDKLILSDSVSAASWNANYEKFKNVTNSYTMSAMTQAEYDALGTYDENTLYITYSENELDIDNVDMIFGESGKSLISAELLTPYCADSSAGLKTRQLSRRNRG